MKNQRARAWLTLTACAVALALVLAGTAFFTAGDRLPQTALQPTPAPTAAPTPQPTPTPDPSTVRSEAADADTRRDAVAEGDRIGRVWVENTQIDCDLYWGDLFTDGAGAHAADGCVLPGQSGTLFIGGHTDTWFADMPAVQDGAVIHVETAWGNYLYRVTEQKEIEDTDLAACHWGDTTEQCILYTCYPFGIQTATPYRWLAYAEPITASQ